MTTQPDTLAEMLAKLPTSERLALAMQALIQNDPRALQVARGLVFAVGMASADLNESYKMLVAVELRIIADGLDGGDAAQLHDEQTASLH